MVEEKPRKEECGYYDGVVLLVGFIVANILTALLGKMIGFDPIIIVLFGLIPSLLINGVALFTAIEEFGDAPLWLRFIVTLSGALMLWALYGVVLLLKYMPWSSISWEAVGHIVALSIIALFTATAIVYKSPEVALMASGAISIYLFIVVALYL